MMLDPTPSPIPPPAPAGSELAGPVPGPTLLAPVTVATAASASGTDTETLAPTTVAATATATAGAGVPAVDRAVAALRQGRFVVVVSEDGDGPGGHLALAAQAVTAGTMAFMTRHTSGVICVALEGRRLDDLQLPSMAASPGGRSEGPARAAGAADRPGAARGPGGPNGSERSEGSEGSTAGRAGTGPVAAAARRDRRHVAFTVSVDAAAGTSTGASAADRCQTVHTLIDPGTRPADLRWPGHVFPVRYHEGGVLRRAGHPEAAVDLARLAGLQPAGVLAELANDDGTTPSRDDVRRFAARHELPVVTITDLVRHRRRRERLVRRVSSARLPTRYGDFTAVVFASVVDGTEHLALVRGDVTGPDGVLGHIHLECPAGDTFGSLLCGCGHRLDVALTRIARADAGVVLYLRRDATGDRGAADPLPRCPHQGTGGAAAGGQPSPDDTAPYDLGAQMLADLGISALCLLAGGAAVTHTVASHGIEVADAVAS